VAVGVLREGSVDALRPATPTREVGPPTSES